MANRFGGAEKVYVLFGANDVGDLVPVGVVRDSRVAEEWMMDDLNNRDFEEFELGAVPFRRVL